MKDLPKLEFVIAQNLPQNLSLHANIFTKFKNIKIKIYAHGLNSIMKLGVGRLGAWTRR
jgi:hypothetical protein